MLFRSVLIVVLLMATSLKSVFAGLSFLFVFSTSNFGALVTALYWKKASKEGALISILVSGITAVVWTATGNTARFDGIFWALMLSMSIMVTVSLIVSKTGPWWGKKERSARSDIKESIVQFLSNRTATMADFIDRFPIHAIELRLAVSELVMNNEIVEIDYLTYILAEYTSPEEKYLKDSGFSRDITMVLAAIASVAVFFVIWNITLP